MQMFRFLENLVDPYTPYAETDTPPQRLWPFLRGHMRPFHRLYAVTAIAVVTSAAIEIWLLHYLGRLVDLLSKTGPAEVWQALGWELLAMALFLLLMRPLVQTVGTGLLNNAILPNLGTLIGWRAHGHVLRQSVGWFEEDFAGRIANRIMQTPRAAGEAVFQLFDALAFSLAYVIGAGVLLAETDWRLVVPLVIWLSLYLTLVRWTVRRIRPASQASSSARSRVTGRVVDAYSNIHSVKMFAHHRRELDYARDAIDEMRRTLACEMRIFTQMNLMLALVNGLLIVAVMGWAIWLWSNGAAGLGLVATAMALTLRLGAMTGWIMWALSSFFQNLGIIAEGMETIAQPITLTDQQGARPLQPGPGALSFDNVRHHYGRGAGGLQGVSLQLEPGEKVGLVGRSGAGKSTLVKLLLRFYDVEGGRIMIDGQDISAVTQDSLRGRIGMVGQDSALLHRSIRENILYGRPDASEAEVIAAAQRASAHDFISDLKDQTGLSGYEAQVGERGVKLSGGQRQRIALARVILKDAPILILDEATSALDSEVEAEILNTLYGVMEGKTVIAIAHRLSTIAHMDRIVVLDQGRIVEQGTHQALLSQGGLYAGFWARQSGGFIDTGPATEVAE